MGSNFEKAQVYNGAGYWVKSHFHGNGLRSGPVQYDAYEDRGGGGGGYELVLGWGKGDYSA